MHTYQGTYQANKQTTSSIPLYTRRYFVLPSRYKFKPYANSDLLRSRGCNHSLARGRHVFQGMFSGVSDRPPNIPCWSSCLWSRTSTTTRTTGVNVYDHTAVLGQQSTILRGVSARGLKTPRKPVFRAKSEIEYLYARNL